MKARHAGCRKLLAVTMVGVRKIFSSSEIAVAEIFVGDRGFYAFHGPHGEYLKNLNADCIWSAKAFGWSRLIDRMFA